MAQLVVRFVRDEEVRGSSPRTPTLTNSTKQMHICEIRFNNAQRSLRRRAKFFNICTVRYNTGYMANAAAPIIGQSYSHETLSGLNYAARQKIRNKAATLAAELKDPNERAARFERITVAAFAEYADSQKTGRRPRIPPSWAA